MRGSYRCHSWDTLGHARKFVHIAGHLWKALDRCLRLHSGALAVEFALIIPVCLMFVFGVVEIGGAIFVDHNLSKAVRDGARYAIVRGSATEEPASQSQIVDYVKSQALGLDPNKIAISISYAPDNAPGSRVTVQADYSHNLMIPIVPVGPITLSSTSTMTIKHPVARQWAA